MKKIICFLVMLVLVTAFVSAIIVTPHQTIELPTISSTVELDTTGILRTYLYCTWHIDDIGEEAILMSGTTCPETTKYYTFDDSEDYYVRIDYTTIEYKEGQWNFIERGDAGELLIEYHLNIPDPEQSVFDMMFNVVLGHVNNLLCNIFWFLHFC